MDVPVFYWAPQIAGGGVYAPNYAYYSGHLTELGQNAELFRKGAAAGQGWIMFVLVSLR